MRATGMQALVEAFDRHFDQIELEGERKGFENGLREGRRRLCCRMAGRKFDAGTAWQLAMLLDRVTDPDLLDEAAQAVMDCDSSDALLSDARRLAAAMEGTAHHRHASLPPTADRGEKSIQGVAGTYERNRRSTELQGERKGYRKGLREGRRRLCCRMAGRKFNADTVRELATLLDRVTDPSRLDEAAGSVFDCDSSEALFRAVRPLAAS